MAEVTPSGLGAAVGNFRKTTDNSSRDISVKSSSMGEINIGVGTLEEKRCTSPLAITFYDSVMSCGDKTVDSTFMSKGINFL